MLEQWLCELHSRITIPLLTALHVRLVAMHAERAELLRRKERLESSLDAERRRLTQLEQPQQQQQAETGAGAGVGGVKRSSAESNSNGTLSSNGSGSNLLEDTDAEFLPAANELVDSTSSGSPFKMKF